MKTRKAFVIDVLLGALGGILFVACALSVSLPLAFIACVELSTNCH